MKVSIITIHRVLNYGTVLQSFATQELIKELGCEVEIIDYITEERNFKKIFLWSPKSLKNFKLRKVIYVLSRFPANLLKHLSFSQFINKYYLLTKRKYYTINDLKKNPPSSDIYLVGSDQVWNSKYNGGVDRGFFLDFGDENTKKISYASSFGSNELQKNDFIEINKLLSKFNFISVREDTGVKILNDMGYSAELVLDPTLMLNKDKWLSYIKSKKINRRYVLLFILYNEDNGATQYARKIADKLGLEVIQLYWKPIKRQGVDRIAIYKSPFEFLRYIRDAEYIVTNSFHGTAFAINFNKQFITVARSEFNTRLESILRLCKLENRYITKKINIKEVIKKINYTLVNEILEKERNKSLSYLEKAIYKRE
ncbi:MAG: polysaccharide pyruvyl transferase family protein [Bacilli bacterium]|nr:polysaccharide pyruvyl transferase family protein [Bacilli bacterium]MDD4733540.1 polysaccharide pyruvyl transferase family protein [Bacilli bacterium]